VRIDVLLNKLCLTKTRSIAKNACDKNLVSINGKRAKASMEVNPGDKVILKLYGYQFDLLIKEIPEGNVAKKDLSRYYDQISRSKLDSDLLDNNI
jgi:ribosomal 50S subunit-recycling heat shock protein